MSGDGAAILKELREVRTELARIAAHLGLGTHAAPTGGAMPAGGQVADDRDLDGDHGDPIIKFGVRERYWKTQPDEHIGLRFSECESEYLDAMAKYLDACAYMIGKGSPDKPADPKKAGYKARDAARARGWALRNKGRAAPEPRAEEEPEIPF